MCSARRGPFIPCVNTALDRLAFIREFAKRPAETGHFVPSGRALASAMITAARVGSAGSIIELGAGTGSFTSCILSRKRSGARFLAVEVNPCFAGILRRRYPELDVLIEPAEELDRYLQREQWPLADAIVCGLPWANFCRKRQEQLLGAVVRSLAPGGRFTTFSYIYVVQTPAGRRFRSMLDEHFGSVKRSRPVWRNLPPAHVYSCGASLLRPDA